MAKKATIKLEDMVDVGIIDPVKVTRIALQKASSVAGTMLTTECVVSKVKTKDDNKSANPMAGMMGM